MSQNEEQEERPYQDIVYLPSNGAGKAKPRKKADEAGAHRPPWETDEEYKKTMARVLKKMKRLEEKKTARGEKPVPYGSWKRK